MGNHKAITKLVLLLAGIIVLGMVAAACGGDDDKEVVRFHDGQWETLWEHNAIAMYITENGYGYPVEEIEGTSVTMQLALPLGEIDVAMELWRQNAMEWYNDSISAGTLVDLAGTVANVSTGSTGQSLETSLQGIYVPTYIIEQNPGLQSVLDLPNFIELFQDPEDSSKGVVVNCIIGWNCQKIIRAKWHAYGLNDTFNLTQLLEGVALIIAMVTVPLMANTVMGKDPLTGGMWLLRLTAAIPVGALLGGRLLSLIGVRPVTAIGLGMSALGLFLVSGWDLGVDEPWLTVHLVIAGLGFGLNNTPIMTRALSSVPDDYRGTAASLVVVARMMGMTLGLAALSAWGVEQFQALTSGLEFPLPLEGETGGALQARLDEYVAQISAAGLALFHDFFRVAGAVVLVAILPTLAMREDREERT